MVADYKARQVLCYNCRSYSSSRKWHCTCKKAWMRCSIHCQQRMFCRGAPRLKRPRATTQQNPGWHPKSLRGTWCALSWRLHQHSNSIRISNYHNKREPPNEQADVRAKRPKSSKAELAAVSKKRHKSSECPSARSKAVRKKGAGEKLITVFKRGIIFPLGPNLLNNFGK